MQSRITIEVDFENGNRPVIQVLSGYSDDVRDHLVSSFLQSLQHTSGWATFEYKGVYERSSGDGVKQRWFIKPIAPTEELDNEMNLMRAEVIRRMEIIYGKEGTFSGRRIRLDLNTPAELAIRNAMKEVEGTGASPMLTDAIILLEKAFNLVADYIDTKEVTQKA